MPFVATWMHLEIIILSEESQEEKEKYYMISFRDFLGGPGVKTQRFQCRGRLFDPWSGNWGTMIPRAVQRGQKIKKKI